VRPLFSWLGIVKDKSIYNGDPVKERAPVLDTTSQQTICSFNHCAPIVITLYAVDEYISVDFTLTVSGFYTRAKLAGINNGTQCCNHDCSSINNIMRLTAFPILDRQQSRKTFSTNPRNTEITPYAQVVHKPSYPAQLWALRLTTTTMLYMYVQLTINN